MAISNELADKSAAVFQGAAATPDPVTQQQLLVEAQRLAGQSELAGAYAFLQRVVGTLAVALPFVLAIGKAAFYRQAELGLAEAYAYTSAVMTRNMMAADAAEGIDAFIAKREPHWRGC